jgi:hypothetical protein
VIAFDLATTMLIVRPFEEQFDYGFLWFSFENLGDKLVSIIEVNFTWDSSEAEYPMKRVDGLCSIFVKVYFAFYSISWAVISKTGDIILANTPDTELVCTPQPNAVNVTPLKLSADGLGFASMRMSHLWRFENPMNGLLRAEQVKLSLNPTGTPRRIFLFEPDLLLF